MKSRLNHTKYLLSPLSAFVILINCVPGVSASRTLAGNQVPFQAVFQGDFRISFGTGPDFTNELFFSGQGTASHLGDSTVNGYSTLSSSSPGCFTIVYDQVMLTAANGDNLLMVNAGDECLDSSVPGKLFIRGSGTYTFVGGTGRFAGATGSGVYQVIAEVVTFGGTFVEGTFVLNWVGVISR